jgi:hypothetical protein
MPDESRNEEMDRLWKDYWSGVHGTGMKGRARKETSRVQRDLQAGGCLLPLLVMGAAAIVKLWRSR